MLSSVSLDLIPPAFQRSYDAIAAFAQGPVSDVIPAIERAIATHVDPEALFLFGLLLIRVDAGERGLEVLGGAVRAGYTPASTLGHNRAFDAVRERESFKAIQAEAKRRMLAAQATFEAAGGPEMLGLPAATRLASPLPKTL